MFAERLPGFKVIFCGYSHGACLAMLAAQNWRFLTGEKPDCAIFGSPMLAWGDSAQRALNDSMSLRCWINRVDEVTAVPLRKWGYRHVREDLVSVRSVPFFSRFRVHKHHQIYDRPEIYPVGWGP